MLPASVLNRLRRRAPTLLLGAVEGAKAFLLAEAQRLLGAPVVAVVSDNDALHRLSENLRAYAPREILLKFPALTGNPFKGEAPHARLLHERAAALGALALGEDFSFLVAAAPAAAMRLAPFAVFDEAAMALQPGGTMSLEEFLRRLEAAGYLHADRVVEPGEYSHRGGVVDVFPPFAPQPSAGEPIRVEFFGDRIESLRRFDPATQRSAGPVERALVTCESEIVLSDAAARRWRDAALARGASQDAAERTARGLERRDRFPGIEFHAAWLYKSTSSLEALLRDRFEPDEMLLAADEPPLCRSERGDGRPERGGGFSGRTAPSGLSARLAARAAPALAPAPGPSSAGGGESGGGRPRRLASNREAAPLRRQPGDARGILARNPSAGRPPRRAGRLVARAGAQACRLACTSKNPARRGLRRRIPARDLTGNAS